MKWGIIVRVSPSSPTDDEDGFMSGRLWPRGAVLKAARRPVRPSRREAGKKRLDLFEITLTIGHLRERPCPALPNWETRWPMNHRRLPRVRRRREPANSFTTVRVATKKRTMMENGRRTGRSQRKGKTCSVGRSTDDNHRIW